MVARTAWTALRDPTKALNYSLNRGDAFTRCLDDGRLLHVEQRAAALRRKNWTLAGSDEGGRRYLHADRHGELDDVDPQACSPTCQPAAGSPGKARSRTPALEFGTGKTRRRSRVRLISYQPKIDLPRRPAAIPDGISTSVARVTTLAQPSSLWRRLSSPRQTPSRNQLCQGNC